MLTQRIYPEMNFQSFQLALKEYRESPKSTSYLLKLGQKDKALAESLLLYHPVIMREIRISDLLQKAYGQYARQANKNRSTSIFKFKNLTKKYSLKNAIWFAALSALAYEKKQTVRKQLVAWGFDKDSIQWINFADTQAFIAAHGDKLILSFRGHSSLIKDVADFKFMKEESAHFKGKVHWVLEKAFEKLKPKILKLIIKYAEGRQLYITGHSLGAALAQLAAYSIREKTDATIAGIYLYGSPNVGNKDFAAAYNDYLSQQTYLHINQGDILTKAPPRLFGYASIGIPRHRFILTDEQMPLDLRSEKELPKHLINKTETASRGDAYRTMKKCRKVINHHSAKAASSPSTTNTIDNELQLTTEEEGYSKNHSIDHYFLQLLRIWVEQKRRKQDESTPASVAIAYL